MVQHDKLQQTLMHLVMILLVLCCVLPFMLMVIASFTEEATLTRNGYSFFPEVLSLETYRYIIRSASTIFRGYFMTIFVTVIGTGCNLLLTILFAYPLSRRDLPYRGFLSFFLFFTMLFNGGLVPTYMMYANTFHIKNTIFALIVPSLMMNAFYVIMMRSFFSSSIPDSLIESAKIEGAGHFKIFTKIIVPVSKPVFGALAILVYLSKWNEFLLPKMFISKTELLPIMVILPTLSVGDNLYAVPWELVLTGCTLVIIPLVIIFLMFQDKFLASVTIGAVKG